MHDDVISTNGKSTLFLHPSTFFTLKYKSVVSMEVTKHVAVVGYSIFAVIGLSSHLLEVRQELPISKELAHQLRTKLRFYGKKFTSMLPRLGSV